MPIRFRCAYCNQLMGIARRKAGTVVRCPKCAGQVIVPAPEAAPGAPPPRPANGAGQIFEQSDFDRFFQQEASQGSSAGGNIGAAPPGPRPVPPPAPAARSPGPDPGFDVEPVPHFGHAIGPGVFLSPGKLAILAATVVLLMGLAFFVGLLVGRAG